jgi:transcription antitermination factor NusG
MAQDRGFETFFPVYRTWRRWSDRQKSIELPLLPGYVFCRAQFRDRLPLLTIPGVIHLVSLGNVPVPMDDAELASLKAAAQYGRGAQPVPFLEIGQRVRVERGPLAGCEGILVEFRDRQRLVLSSSLLHRAMAVEINRAWVKPIAAESYNQDNADSRSAIEAAPEGSIGAY